MGEAVVTVLVGPDEKRYTVHKSLLTAQSEYFDRALNGKFKEADEQTIRLTEESPDAFDLLIGWLYQGQLPVAGFHSTAFDTVPSGEDTEVEVHEPSMTSKPPPPNTGTFDLQYTPVNEAALSSAQVNSFNTWTDRYMHICRQPFYQSASPEELRLADYARNHRFQWEPIGGRPGSRLPEPFPVATGHLKGIPHCPSIDIIMAAEEAHQLSLLRLCLFAETICWTPLFNLAMTAYVEGENNLRHRPMPKEHVQLIYQRAHDESPCRRFAADSTIAQVGAVGQVDRNMDLVDQWPSFLEDIFRRMSLSTTLTQSRSPKNMPPCEYHDHPTQAENVRCSAIGPAQQPVQPAVDLHTANLAAATSIFRPSGDTMDWIRPAPGPWTFRGFTGFTPLSAAGPYQPNAQAGAYSSAAAGGSTTAVFGAATTSSMPAAGLGRSVSSLFDPLQSAGQQSAAPATAAGPSLFGTPSFFGTPSLLGQNQPAGLPSTITSTSTIASAVSLPSMSSSTATITPSTAPGTSSGGFFGSATNTKTAQTGRSPSAVFGQVSPLGSKLPPPTVAATSSGGNFGSSSRAASTASTSSSAFSGIASFATTAASSRPTSASGGISGTVGGSAAAPKAISGGLFGGASTTATTAVSSAGAFGGGIANASPSARMTTTTAPFLFGGSTQKTSPPTTATTTSAPSSHSIVGSAPAVSSASASSGASGDSISAVDTATALQIPLSGLFSNTRLVPSASNSGFATVTLPTTNATPVFSATASAPRDFSVSNIETLRSRSSSVSTRKDENTGNSDQPGSSNEASN